MDEIVEINFLGEHFRFKPDGQVKDPKAVVEYLTQHIEDAQHLFEQTASGHNKLAILLMAAMNLSKEVCELKTKQSQFEKNIAGRISSLSYKIDKGMA